MSRDQRVADNHALIAAQKHALELRLPLAVVFCLYPKSGHRAREQYDFMLEGLTEIESQLASLNIPFILLIGKPEERLLAAIHHFTPAAVYLDFNPLKGPQTLAKKIAAVVPTVIVDAHNVVPVQIASDKQEYAARTLRPKIHHFLPFYLQEPDHIVRHEIDWSGEVVSIKNLAEKIHEVVASLPANNSSLAIKSGETSAKSALDFFVQNKLAGYAERRNNPALEGLSELSPYLHFGQLSALRVALTVYGAVANDASLQTDADALIEELVVRKELSDNYCYYNRNYDSLRGAADWALATLEKHSQDTREFMYTKEQFEHAKTHDEAWNAAQRQLTRTGKMHGYMRMYWAKKVLEWSASPAEAHQILVYLNDFYSIDGGDPNGYVGILWSVAGLHDRPWGERLVYGTIRSMVFAGLKRKFDVAAYIEQNTH